MRWSTEPTWPFMDRTSRPAASHSRRSSERHRAPCPWPCIARCGAHSYLPAVAFLLSPTCLPGLCTGLAEPARMTKRRTLPLHHHHHHHHTHTSTHTHTHTSPAFFRSAGRWSTACGRLTPTCGCSSCCIQPEPPALRRAGRPAPPCWLGCVSGGRSTRRQPAATMTGAPGGRACGWAWVRGAQRSTQSAFPAGVGRRPLALHVPLCPTPTCTAGPYPLCRYWLCATAPTPPRLALIPSHTCPAACQPRVYCCTASRYWLYATVAAGARGLLVSNDEMRDHTFQVPVAPAVPPPPDAPPRIGPHYLVLPTHWLDLPPYDPPTHPPHAPDAGSPLLCGLEAAPPAALPLCRQRAADRGARGEHQVVEAVV
jgi:hypothetical protein